ncbi:hypothetical protein HOS47_gp22 [Pseudomonas phage uligo]|uniref:Uncharacterized protein n=1 Tax=Pseudomonas phage uligo TaxID=2048979 RepID=A0A2H4P7P6_9CAUD|nr:hypothetical protein HOS47_gp22 [Pseudomonas phage uligo]ATW58181.1 hypothetical protein [Pseudomonas phage uligo]
MKVLIIGGARACGKSSLIRQLLAQGELSADIQLVDEHPIQQMAYAMSELLTPRGSYDKVVALEEKVRNSEGHTFIHLRTDPAILGIRLRQRRLAGDEEFKRDQLMNLDAYLDAVIPQLCKQRGIRYVPVRWGKGVSMFDILPTIKRIMLQ